MPPPRAGYAVVSSAAAVPGVPFTSRAGAAGAAAGDEYGTMDRAGSPARAQGGSATIPSSMINLVNTIIGAGMLSIPNALDDMGFVIGGILLVACAAAASFGLSLLVECAVRTGEAKTSYYVVARRNVGTAATVLVDLSVALKCFGVGIAYLVVVGDLMPDAMDGFGVTTYPFTHRRFWISCAMPIVVLLSFLRRLDSLRFTSAASLCTAAYLTGVLIYFAASKGIDTEHVSATNKIDTDFLSALPVLVFAYTCHQNIFSIHSELERNTPSRVTTVIACSVLICLSVYIAVGVCGVFTLWEEDVKSNIIRNLPNDSVATNIGRIAMSINVTFSFALQSHPCRECVTNMALLALEGDGPAEPTKKVASAGAANLALPETEAPFSPKEWRGSPAEPAAAPAAGGVRGIAAAWIRRRTWGWNCGVAVVICAASYLVAYILDDLGTVFGVVGGTGSTALCYILPGGLYLRSETLLAERDGLPRPWDCRRVMAAVLFVVGIVMVGVSNYAVFSKSSSDDDVASSPFEAREAREWSDNLVYNLF